MNNTGSVKRVYDVTLKKIEIVGEHIECINGAMCSIAPARALSGILTSFPIRALSSPTDLLHENEVLVIVRNMAGTDHIAAIDKSEYSGTLYLFAGHICNVYYELVHLSVDCMTIGYDVSMTDLVPLLERTQHVIHVLVKDPPDIIPSFMCPDILKLL